MSGAAAAQQAITNALMASGAIVKIDENSFINLLSKMEGAAVVIEAKGGIFNNRWNYLTNYKGFFFFTKSKERIGISTRHELIQSNKIWVPGV